MKIYLSPANHHKPYVITGYTEKPQMEQVARAVFDMLQGYECDVMLPTVFNKDGQYTGRPKEAKAWGAEIYIAIHSNAAGQMGAYATGAVGFYHKNNPKSKVLAQAIQSNIDSICPIPSNRYDNIIDGMTMFNGSGLGEIREPQALGITPCLIEVNFHSYYPTARWIIDNTALIAQAITDGIVNTYNLQSKEELILIEQLRAEIQSLKDRMATIECPELIYNDIVDIPIWAKPTIQKLVDLKHLQGDEHGRLNLKMSDIRILVILDRAGAF